MRKRVLVIIGWHNPNTVRGFCRYARRAGWVLDTFSLMTGGIPESWHGHGVLTTNVNDPRLQQRLRTLATRLPVVLHGTDVMGGNYPSAEVDERMTGRMAAEHFLARGYARFADLMQTNDAAESAGWRVPEDLGVVGVGDNEVICEYSRVPISGVRLPAEQQAYEAARMLDLLMKGREPSVRHIVLPPAEVIVRRSSDYLAVRDPALRRAVAFLRESYRSPDMTVRRIAAAAGVSPAKLHVLFRDELRLTPARLLQRLRFRYGSSQEGVGARGGSVCVGVCSMRTESGPPS